MAPMVYDQFQSGNVDQVDNAGSAHMLKLQIRPPFQFERTSFLFQISLVKYMPLDTVSCLLVAFVSRPPPVQMRIYPQRQ